MLHVHVSCNWLSLIRIDNFEQEGVSPLIEIAEHERRSICLNSYDLG
jgi:hypothetical protein